MIRRTPKKFQDYNDYHDRGFMKWITAFAMEELMRGIKQNQKEAMKNNAVLPKMTPEEIDAKLAEASHTKRPISIQLNQKDKWGRQTDSIEGRFQGYLPGGQIKIEDRWLALQDIRNITFLNEGKWSQITPFKKAESFRVEEPEIKLVDDFSQDGEWIE
ncbi:MULTISPECIES: hypothetical protein [unclassified Jeotgalibaca]|uniref:hypothetical protein n=1 Tax=unclassified Jeotgalibaca TaxID=2621505 RepID=UPI003FD3432E